MSSFLNDQIQQQIREAFQSLANPIKILLFTQDENSSDCEYCEDTRQLLTEVTELSDKITLEVHNFAAEPELAAQYRIDKVPATAILINAASAQDHGIRLFGLPSGYEFSTLIEDILMVSQQRIQLNAQTLDQLKHLTKPIDIQVFVTPTCPYCPRAVLLAHQLAMANNLITASMIEANEFPELSAKYQVYGVPRTVIDDVIHIEGAVPEAALVSELMKVLDTDQMQQLRSDWELSLN